MGITFKKTVELLPFGSITDLMVNFLKNEGQLESENLGPAMLTKLDEKIIPVAMRMVTRFAVLYFLFPRITWEFSVYNVAVGVCHGVTGFMRRFRTAEFNESNREAIAKEFRVGFIYGLTAVYDLALGYFLKTQPLGVIGALVFSAAPRMVVEMHYMLFKNPAAPAPETSATSSQPLCRAYLAPECYIYRFADRGADRVTRELLPPVPPSSATVESPK